MLGKVVDEKNKESGKWAKVTGFPTFIYYKNGKELERIEGADWEAVVTTIEFDMRTEWWFF